MSFPVVSTTTPEQDLLIAILLQAVRDARQATTAARSAESLAAKEFLCDTVRIEPFCEALGMDVAYFQTQLRQESPAIFT